MSQLAAKLRSNFDAAASIVYGEAWYPLLERVRYSLRDSAFVSTNSMTPICSMNKIPSLASVLGSGMLLRRVISGTHADDRKKWQPPSLRASSNIAGPLARVQKSIASVALTRDGQLETPGRVNAKAIVTGRFSGFDGVASKAVPIKSAAAPKVAKVNEGRVVGLWVVVVGKTGRIVGR
jgi:hypothetical protein